MSFDTAVSVIEACSAMDKYHKQVDDLRRLDEGTLGKNIANCLDQHRLTLVPKFESHDLKHVLLNYKMTAEDEIRLQAFMIGNGNYSIPSFVIFLFGAILLPDLWQTFYTDFKKGRQTISISKWTIDDYAHRPISVLRAVLAQSKPKESYTINMKHFIKFIATATVIAGVFGMLF